MTSSRATKPQDYPPHRLLRGEQAVTPEMALRLGKLCGNGPEFWMRMPMLRDLWRPQRTLAADLASIPTHRAGWANCDFSPRAAIYYRFLAPLPPADALSSLRAGSAFLGLR